MGKTKCAACGKTNRVPEAPRGAPSCGECKKLLPWIVAGTDGNFDQEINVKLPVLVDLWAPWCGPCRMVAPILEKIAVKYAGKLKIIKVNVDDNPVTQARYRAMSIPTMVLLRNGREMARKVGAMPQPELEKWLASSGVTLR